MRNFTVTLRKRWAMVIMLSPIAGALAVAIWLSVLPTPLTAVHGNSFTVNPSSGPPGTSVSLAGSGWTLSPVNPLYQIFWDAKGGLLLEDFTPDANGSWTKKVTIPSDSQLAQPGPHQIFVCEGVGGEFQECLSEPFTVDTPTPIPTATSTSTPAPAAATPLHKPSRVII